jgi:hypothetical protein
VADARGRGLWIANSRNPGFPAAVNLRTAAASAFGSIPKIGLEFRQFYWYGGFLRYSAKHFRAVKLKVICLAVLVGSWSLNPIAVIGKVVRLAGGLVSLASAG